MWKSTALCAGLLLWAGLTARLAAQVAVPGAPAAPGAPTAAVPATPATAAPAQPTTLWSFLGISQANCQKCRTCLCQSPLGQMLNSMTQPAGLATGGLLPPLCPPPSIAALQALGADPNASPEEAAAAKIKADEAGAAARRAAVRYLGTVDCHRYPEAEKALIAALRTDRNECVRWEAALSLSRGCCCTKDTIAALTLAVTGAETDHNPSEMSDRVRAAAAYALQICMCRYRGHIATPQAPPEAPPEAEPPDKGPPSRAAGPGQVGVALTTFYSQQVERASMAQLVQEAGRALAATVGTREAPRMAVPGQHGLLGMLNTPSHAPPAEEEVRYEAAALGPPGHLSAPRASLDFQAAERAPAVAKAEPAPTSEPVQPPDPRPEANPVQPASAVVPAAPVAPASSGAVSPPVFPVGASAASAAAAPPAPAAGVAPEGPATVSPPVFPVGTAPARPGTITTIRGAAPQAEALAQPTHALALLPPLPVGQ